MGAYLVVYAQSFLDVIGQPLGLPSPFVLSAIGWIVFLVVLLTVLIVLSCMRSRVLQNAAHNVGVIPSVSRFAVGAACGLLLVICLAVPTLLFSDLPARFNQLAAEFQGSISFPMLKSISDRVRTWTADLLPQPLEFLPPHRHHELAGTSDRVRDRGAMCVNMTTAARLCQLD